MDFYCAIIPLPFFRYLISKSLFHGLKAYKCRFTSKDDEAVCPTNWICFPSCFYRKFGYVTCSTLYLGYTLQQEAQHRQES